MKRRVLCGRVMGLLAGIVAAGGCEPAKDVQVLPLPPLERLTPEARYGLPEVKGLWRFAGWEVEPGDSVLLERSYPAFGSLDLRVQRLDSIAGVLAVPGGESPVVGEIRRDGWFALAALSGPEATAYLSGRFASDTLRLEMTSVFPAADWPAGATGIFVREGDGLPGPIAWFRGTSPFAPAAFPDSLLADSQATDSLVSVPVAIDAGGEGAEAGAGAVRGTTDEAVVRAPTVSPPAATTPVVDQPARPTPPAVPRPVPPAPRPVREEPTPAPREREEGPRLLGEPIAPQ